MSDYLATCGQCNNLKPNFYCHVKNHTRKPDRIICEHFDPKDKQIVKQNRTR